MSSSSIGLRGVSVAQKLTATGSPAAVFSSLKYTQIRLPKVLNCYRLCCIMMMSNSIIHYSQFGGLVMFIEERHQKISDTIKANGKIPTPCRLSSYAFIMCAILPLTTGVPPVLENHLSISPFRDSLEGMSKS